MYEKIKQEIYHYPMTNREEEQKINIGTQGWRSRYYDMCLNIYDEDDVSRCCLNYLEGMKWTFEYYFEVVVLGLEISCWSCSNIN